MTVIANLIRFASPTLLGAAGLIYGDASAHGIWVAQRAGEWAVVLGEASADDAYKASAIQAVAAQAGDGSMASVTLVARERNAVLTPSPTAASIGVAFEDGFWSEASDGRWVEGSRLQQPGARKTGYYRMFSRTVIARSTTAAKPFGHPLEILPLIDPLALKRGDRLPVRVLFEGKPLAGAVIAADYLNGGAEPKARTDAKGNAVITLRSAGLNVIKANHSVPRSDKREADEDGYAATLAFALPQPKD